MTTLADLAARVDEVTPQELAALSDEDFFRISEEALQLQAAQRQENAILFYKPVSDEARKFNLSEAQIAVALGGNGSSKTESQLARLVTHMTGVIPTALEKDFPKGFLRPPINP